MGIPQEIIEGTAVADDPASWGEAYNIQCGVQNTMGKTVDHSPDWDSSQSFQRVKILADGVLLFLCCGHYLIRKVAIGKAKKTIWRIGDQRFGEVAGKVIPPIL